MKCNKSAILTDHYGENWENIKNVAAGMILYSQRV